jgi:AbiTii
MSKRKKTPQEIETDVLTKSARRCCICFGVQMDLSTKKGQIAHLDGDPSNSEMDNLAYLCMPHHDDYDSKTSQSKGLTTHEVKSYRTLLYEAIHQMRMDLPLASTRQTDMSSKVESSSAEISSLLSRIQSRVTPLSECLVQGLTLAQGLRDTSLEKFCRAELSGYADKSVSPPTYRIIDVFITGNARINMQSPDWSENLDNVFEYMRRDTEHFVPHRIAVAHSVSTIESQTQNVDLLKGIVLLSLKFGDIDPKASNPNLGLVAYATPLDYQGILEAVRRELTVRLLDTMPKVDEE